MLVSIVIPALNEEKYLGQTLTALKGQNHPDFDLEVIVADAMSTDRTAAIAQANGAWVITAKNVNPATARQAGIEAAHGEIVVCLDADTLPSSPEWLNNLVKPLRNDDKMVAVTGTVAFANVSPCRNWLYSTGTTLHYLINHRLGKKILQGQNFAFKKFAFEKIGGLNVNLSTGEDLDLGLRLSRIGQVSFQSQAKVVTSLRRTKEGWWAIARGLLSYLEVVWGLKFLKVAGQPFPSLR